MTEEVHPYYRFKEEKWNKRFIEVIKTLTLEFYCWKGDWVIPMVFCRKLVELERINSLTEVECWIAGIQTKN